jgi:hypothetical protein
MRRRDFIVGIAGSAAAIGYWEFMARLGELIDVGAPFIRISIPPCMAIRARRPPFLLEAPDRSINSIPHFLFMHGTGNLITSLSLLMTAMRIDSSG